MPQIQSQMLGGKPVLLQQVTKRKSYLGPRNHTLISSILCYAVLHGSLWHHSLERCKTQSMLCSFLAHWQTLQEKHDSILVLHLQWSSPTTNSSHLIADQGFTTTYGTYFCRISTISFAKWRHAFMFSFQPAKSKTSKITSSCSFWFLAFSAISRSHAKLSCINQKAATSSYGTWWIQTIILRHLSTWVQFSLPFDMMLQAIQLLMGERAHLGEACILIYYFYFIIYL